MSGPLHGIIPAIITPFADGGRHIDIQSLLQVCDFLISKGVDGLFVIGTTGEGPLLSVSERKETMEAVIRHVDGKVKVVIHTGDISTDVSIDLTCHAKTLGADAATLVTPYYFGLSQKELSDHCISVARAVGDWPVYLYNIPSATRNDLELNSVREINELAPNVIGIKDSSGNFAHMQSYIHGMTDQFDVLCGSDPLFAAALLMGARGIVSSIAGSFPEPYVALKNAFDRLDLDGIRQNQRIIDHLVSVMTKHPTHVMIKSALHLRGLPEMGLRRPFQSIPAEVVELLGGVVGEIAGLERV